MNVFKYIWLKVVGHFKGTQVVYEKSPETLTEKLLEKYPQDLPPKEKDPSRWKTPEETNKLLSDLQKYPVSTQNDLEKSNMLQELLTLKHTADKLRDDKRKPKRPYNRATKQQVARIKMLVGRGKTAKQIAKDVGLPYDNVNYYVKKFGG